MSDSAPLPKLEGVHLSDRVDEGIGAGRFYGQMEGGRAAEVLLCPAQERGRFLTWARRFEQINHPTIPLALRVEEYAEPGFIAFDRVTLPSLAAWLRQRGRPLAALDAVALTLQIAAALRAAHRAQVYHGQLSPEAVRLAERAEGFFDVRLIGWGPPSLPFAEGVLEDIRGLGRLLYTALSAQPLPPAPPRVEDPLRHGLGGGDFDALLLELFDEQQALHGLHELALNAARRPHTFEHLDAVIEALLPHLQGGLAHNTHAAAWLAHNHNFLAEVNRRRARWAALRDQLAEEEAWQRSHQAQIAEAEAAQRQDLKSLQACQWLTTTLSRGLERPITLNLTAPSPAPLRALPGPDPFDAFIAPDLQPRVAVDYQAPFIEEARPPLMAPRPPSPPMAPPAPQPSPVEPIEDAQIAPLEPTAPPKGAQSLLFMGLGAAMILGVTLSITLVLHLYDEPHQAEPIAVGADAASTPSAPKPSASTPSAPPAPSAPEPAPPFV
ncbi:hypothetical protein KKB55_18260, partial [Myxococcota bacterium]|nr:hypothetical protein [Myxococcota bacterium]